MRIDDFRNTQPHTDEIDVGADATSLLRKWHELVSGVPDLVSTEGRRSATSVLVVWYQRVFERADYAADPPIEGLDALIDELASASIPQKTHAELARARWAIRVAEELVKWRDCLRREGAASSPTGPATDRLELAMEEACRHIDDSSGGTVGAHL
jgi:hypothetical protein